MSHSSDDRPQLKFTPEFYNGHPRSKQIRAICLEALEVAQHVLDHRDTSELGRLLDCNRQLTQLKVIPLMHTIEDGDPETDIKKLQLACDPVLAAEYVAGQIQFLLQESQALVDPPHPSLFLEHSESLGPGGPLFMEASTANPKVTDFHVTRTIINLMRLYLADESS